jgi:hypothetical protein
VPCERYAPGVGVFRAALAYVYTSRLSWAALVSVNQKSLATRFGFWLRQRTTARPLHARPACLGEMDKAGRNAQKPS